VRPDCPEDEFEDALLALASLHGWHAHCERKAFTRDGKRVLTPIKGHRGYPDVTAVHPARGLVVAELKSATGRFGPGQREWITALAAHEAANPDLLVEAWYPADWAAIELCFGAGVRAYRARYRRVASGPTLTGEET